MAIAHYEVCEATKEGAKECATYNVLSYALHKIGTALNDYNGAITAIATAFIAWFTLSLRRSTDKLWDAGERQLRHVESEAAAAADFHRSAQFEQIAEQIEALRNSAEAAEGQVFETRELAFSNAMNAQRQLRAYVLPKMAVLTDFLATY